MFFSAAVAFFHLSASPSFMMSSLRFSKIGRYSMKVFGKQQPIQHERAKKAQQSVPGAASQSTLITQTHASRYIYLNSVVEKQKEHKSNFSY